MQKNFERILTKFVFSRPDMSRDLVVFRCHAPIFERGPSGPFKNPTEARARAPRSAGTTSMFTRPTKPRNLLPRVPTKTQRAHPYARAVS